jgi:hypothetical protein
VMAQCDKTWSQGYKTENGNQSQISVL